MAEKMAAEKATKTNKKSSLDDLDEDILLSENVGESSSVAGKRKHETKSQKPSGSGSTSSKGKKPMPKGDKVNSPPKSTPPELSRDDAILAALKNIQDTQTEQRDDIKSLKDRIQNLEEYEEGEYDEYDENYDESHNDNNNDDENHGEDHDGDDQEPPQKKQKSDNSNNRFSSLSKRLKVQEKVDENINEDLAKNINELFRNGMSEDQYSDLVKDDNNARPENCEGLSIVRINSLIWNILSPSAQSADRKLQFIERSVIKASTILAKTVSKMAAEENKDPNVGKFIGECIDSCNDVLALLGHSNRQLNMARRDFLRPEVLPEYIPLCSHSLPYTDQLFGDDVTKVTKDIEDCSKVGNKLRGTGRGGGRGGRGGRGRGGFTRGGRGGFRGGFTQRGGRGQPRGGRDASEKPKNFSRGGSSTAKDRN